MNIRSNMPVTSLGVPNFYNENEVADSQRLIAEINAPASEPTLGEIILLRHGGSNRPVITRSGAHKRFRMSSTKTGMSEVGEGKGEELLAMTCDIDPEVSNFKCHPYKFKLALGSSPFSYCPDIAIQYCSGLFEVVEVKRSPADLTPELKERLGRVEEFVRRCGWRFSIRYLDEIKGSKHRVGNVERLFGRRALPLTERELLSAEAMRLRGTPVRWGELVQRLSRNDTRHGNAVVEHLITASYFAVDLDSKFTDETLLSPIDKSAQLPVPGFALGDGS